MNVRKNIDYSEMYEAMDTLMTQQLLQMELYYEIGKVVCRRTEKGAAVMASEYLNKYYPDAHGFSPRNLRRMRDFYRTYENYPALLSLTMALGWTQNVVIMEADLTMELRKWYLRAAAKFGWSKVELITKIEMQAHLEIALNEEVVEMNTFEKNEVRNVPNLLTNHPGLLFRYVRRMALQRCRGRPKILAYEVDRNKWLNVGGKTFQFARKNQFFKTLIAKKVKFYDTDFSYPEPEERTKNYEYATRAELYATFKKLKKMIHERLKKDGEQEKLTMSPEEAELYEELVDVWEQEETVYFG